MPVQVVDGPSYAAALMEILQADELAKGALLERLAPPLSNGAGNYPPFPSGPAVACHNRGPNSTTPPRPKQPLSTGAIYARHLAHRGERHRPCGALFAGWIWE